MTTVLWHDEKVEYYSVGWYGVPGGRPGTLVHLHNGATGRPACGVTLHPDSRYQWCSWTNLRYIECLTCQRIAAKLIRDAPPDMRAALRIT